MEINDTLQLSVVTPPSGVTFVADDPEEITIATLAPPRVEEAAPEVEEETELVGEAEGEGGEAADGAGDSGGDSEGE
jgi:large subunit ribosomal protein L25